MDLEEAKDLLRTAVKSELRDHAFGDCEVLWYLNGTEIASGYFGSGGGEVSISGTRFISSQASALRDCFASEEVERNDSTGPDTFVVGQTMPGLTLEGVRRELEGT